MIIPSMKASGVAVALRRRVGVAVKTQRVALGLTQEELAAKARMGWRHLQKIEAGQVNVTLRTLARLGIALNVDPGSLLAREK